MLHEEALTAQIIGAAIEVHRRLGPGSWSQLIKPAWPGNYRCENIPFEREVSLPIEYEGIQIDCSYRLF